MGITDPGDLKLCTRYRRKHFLSICGNKISLGNKFAQVINNHPILTEGIRCPGPGQLQSGWHAVIYFDVPES